MAPNSLAVRQRKPLFPLLVLMMYVSYPQGTSATDFHHPRIIWADHTEFKSRVIYINGTGQQIYDHIVQTNSITTMPIHHDFYGKFVSLSFDYEDSRLFVSDVAQKKIIGIQLDEGSGWEIYPGISPVVDGITVDWLAKNIYWTDAVYNWVKVSNVDGSYYRSLITTGLDHPSGIACNPRTGYLYWSDIGRMNKIERSTLAGEERTLLLDENSNAIGKPTSLTIDHIDNILYWVDSLHSSIRTLDLNVENARPNEVLQIRNSGTLFGMDVDPAFGFFVTERENNYLNIVPLDIRKATKRIFLQYDIPNGVIYYSNTKQPQQYAPCETAGCNQLCVSSAVYCECVCTYGYKLRADHKTCERDDSSIYDHEMIYSWEDNGLCVFPPNIAHHPRPYYRDCFSGLVVDNFDLDVYGLYLFLILQSDTSAEIGRMRLEGTEQWESIIQVTSSDVRGIAVDWVASNLYITDTGKSQILISALDGRYLTTLIDSELDYPSAVVVHAPKQYLFWTDTGPFPRIERSDLTGRRDRKVLVNTDLVSPTHLVIDIQNDRIYWADGGTLLIESMDLDGQKREIFYNYTGLTDDPAFQFTGLAIFQDLLYASETGVLVRVFDIPNKSWISHLDFGDQVTAMKFFHESLQPIGQGLCDILNGGCDEICINAKHGAECICSQSHNCTTVFRCPLTIANGQFVTKCDNRNGQSCDFTCNRGYIRATDDAVTCTDHGEWSINSQVLCVLPPRCPLEIPNGRISEPCDNEMDGSCNYTCHEGYRPAIADTLTCERSGQWSIPAGDLCLLLQCFSEPCQNGGNCTEQENGFNCTCSSNWQGDTCEQELEEATPAPISSSEPNVATISISVVIGVLVIAILAVVVFLFRRKIFSTCHDPKDHLNDAPNIAENNPYTYSGAPTAPPASAPAPPPMQQQRHLTPLELKIQSLEGQLSDQVYWNPVVELPPESDPHTYNRQVMPATGGKDDYHTLAEMYPDHGGRDNGDCAGGPHAQDYCELRATYDGGYMVPIARPNADEGNLHSTETSPTEFKEKDYVNMATMAPPAEAPENPE